MKNSITSLLLLALFTTSCEKVEYHNDNPFFGLNTRVLMHMGCGANNPDYRENTFEAAQYGLSIMDGIELELGSIVGVSVGRGVGQSMRAELLPVNLQSEGPSFFAKSVPLQIKYAPSPTTAKAPRTSTAREVLVI